MTITIHQFPQLVEEDERKDWIMEYRGEDHWQLMSYGSSKMSMDDNLIHP